jgi:hypothetical protein
VTTSRPAEPGEAGAGEHHPVDDSVGHELSLVSTLPRTGTTSSPRPSACSCAVRRGEPVPDARAGGQLAEHHAVPRDECVPGVLAGRYGSDDEPLRVGRRQVLERVHGEVDLARVQRVAERCHEDSGAADLRECSTGRVAVRRDLDELDGASAGCGEGVRDQARLGHRERAPAGADPQRRGHVASPAGLRTSVPTSSVLSMELTASMARGSRSNRSRSAAA